MSADPFLNQNKVLIVAGRADADPRSVRKEIQAPGSVRGRAGERIRRELENLKKEVAHVS